jgi:hypothetical protein
LGPHQRRTVEVLGDEGSGRFASGEGRVAGHGFEEGTVVG